MTTYPIPLFFIPPSDPDIVTLHVFESDNAETGFVEIDSVSAGNYPNYISRFVTLNGISPNDWFAIQWEDAGGAKSVLSAPIQCGTNTLIGEIVDRALLRSPGLNENIVLQEAEGIVSWVYKVEDPYTINLDTVNAIWLNGLSELTMVAALYVTSAENQALSQGYSAGIISESQGSSKDALDALERLEKRILRRMGIGGSFIAQMNPLSRKEFIISGEKEIVDASRLLSVKAIITERMLVQDIPTGFVISE